MPDKYDPDDAFPTKKLLKRLAAVNRPSSYCTSGTCPLVLPGLEVEGLGVIGLPVSPVAAARIITACNQAPYGKGTQTIVDTSVRKVWELDAQKFTLSNPQWSVMIEGVLRAIEKALGLSTESLTAHIYKLLVYEPGGFFLMHRDGEKLDRMVATLVVNLPSQHDGGELVVLHQGHQSVLKMPGAASGFSIEYAAFYSDCQHEVKPVVTGNRVCLTYNLVLADSHKHSSIGAPDFKKVEDDLARLIGSWCESVVEHGDEPVKVAVMLDHRYSEDGLSIHNLKGTDQAKAEVLFNAAAKANCDAHLALITLYENGSVEGGYGYGSYSDDDYHEDDEEEEEDEALAVSSNAVVDEDGVKRSKHVMGEVFDSSLTADHWSDRNGAIVPFGRVSLLDEEIVTNRELADGRPSVEEYEGYTGNAGMTLERWYHRAAIVLWPRAIQFQIYLEAGTEVAVVGLAQLIGQQNSNNQAAGGVNCEALRSFAQTIIETWQLHRSSNPESFFSSLELLDAAAAGDCSSLRRYYHTIQTRRCLTVRFIGWRKAIPRR